MANQIVDAYKSMDENLTKFNIDHSDDDEDVVDGDDQQEMMQELLSKPLQESYRLLLQDLRFDYISMKETTKYKHHYHSSIQSNYTPS
jgi:hypothetical protein